MMALPSLTDLLTVPSQQDCLDDEVFPELATRAVAITDWRAGGAYIGLSFVTALMRVSARAAVAALAAGGFEDYAFGFATLPSFFTAAQVVDVLGWAPIIAKQRYGLDQISAIPCRRTLTITNATGTTYGPLSPGAMVVQFPSGDRYVLNGSPTDPTATTTIAASTTTLASFVAETAAANYTDVCGASPIILVTASYPGVTVTSVAIAPATTDITQQARDAEPPQQLGARCRGLVPLFGVPRDANGNAISISPTASGYECLARTASDNVVQVLVTTSNTVNNEINIVIATATSPCDAGTVSAVQDYLDHFSMLTDYPVVSTPTTQAITLGGATIKCLAASVAAAQVSLQAAVKLYLEGLDVRAPLGISDGSTKGIVRHDWISTLITLTPGVTGFVDGALTINAAAADYQIPAGKMATWSQDVSTCFSWVNV